MITFKLKSDAAKSKYWMLSLPEPYEGRVDNVLQFLKVKPYTMKANSFVFDVDTSLPMHHLKGQMINLHEASHCS